MIVVLRAGATDEERDAVVRELEGLGLGVRALGAGAKPLLHVISGPSPRARRVLGSRAVEALVSTSGPRLRRFGHRIYPYHFIRWSAAGVFIFGLAVLLAGQFPPGTGAALELERPPAAHPWPWYLRAPRAIVHVFGPEQRSMGWGLLSMLLLGLFCLPLFDRTRTQGLRERWPFACAGLALLWTLLYFTWRGA